MNGNLGVLATSDKYHQRANEMRIRIETYWRISNEWRMLGAIEREMRFSDIECIASRRVIWCGNTVKHQIAKDQFLLTKFPDNFLK